MSKLIVLGSVNADHVLKVPSFPRPGETLHGSGYCVIPGGKGANQAVAAARLGADIGFIASVGDDAFGLSIRESFAEEGIDTSAVLVEEGTPTGIAMIQVADMDEAVAVANYIAPEHLELSVDDPAGMANQIRHAGAIFMGRYTAEALGDYCAGPNHVLPTSRTARFSSPLGVYDFQKRTSMIQCSAEGASELGRTAAALAHGEGLTAHARSAEVRIRDKD